MARDRDRTAAKPERKNCQLGGPVASKWDLTHGSGSTSVNGVDSHPPHANTRQVQTNRHNIRHRGLLGPANLVTHRFQRGLTPTVIATSPGFWDVSPGFWGSSPKFTDFANLNGIGQQLEVVIGSLEATTLHNVHYGTFWSLPGWPASVPPVPPLRLLDRSRVDGRSLPDVAASRSLDPSRQTRPTRMLRPTGSQDIPSLAGGAWVDFDMAPGRFRKSRHTTNSSILTPRNLRIDEDSGLVGRFRLLCGAGRIRSPQRASPCGSDHAS